MSYLSQGTKAVIKPPILTIVGFSGAGKTTLASLFPNPAFIQAEDSQAVFETLPEDQQPHFNPMLPKPNKKRSISTKEVLLAQLREFVTEEHQFQTLIIDSVSVLNDLFEQEIVEYQPGKTESVNDAAGGFQKAHDIIANWHEEVISACNIIRERKNMGIVFLAHAMRRKVKNHAEASGDFTVYGMRMHEKSEDIYISHCNAVVYLKQLESVIGNVKNDKGQSIKLGRKRMSAERILITASDGVEGFVSAKTRYEMPVQIDCPKGTNPLLQYIPYYHNYVAQNKLEVPQEVETEVEEDIDQ